MSDLRLIYQAVAAMPVGAAGVVPRTQDGTAYAYAFDQLPKVSTAIAPCRLLLPFGTKTEAKAIMPVTFGGRMLAEWKLTDLLLWAPTAQGTLADHAAALIEYLENYVGALETLKARLAVNGRGGVVESLTMEPGVFTYPASATGSEYFGVEVTLSVKE